MRDVDGREIGDGHSWPLMERLSVLYNDAISDYVRTNRQGDER